MTNYNTAEHIIACIETLTVWNFYDSKELAESDLERVQKKCLDDASDCERNHIEHGYSDRDPNYWLKQSAKYKLEAESYQVMTWETYKSAEASAILSEPLLEITEERYNYLLEVLPPLKWGNNRGVYSFFMSEFESGNYTQQVAEMSGRYWSKVVDFRKPETWINFEMLDSAKRLEEAK